MLNQKAAEAEAEKKDDDFDDHAEALDGMIAHDGEAADDDHPDEELKMIIGEAKTREEAEKNAGFTFDRLDKNKDGSLSIDEILALVEKSDQTDDVKDEAADLVKAIDADENGKVDKSEWSKAFGSIFEMLHQKEPKAEADKKDDDFDDHAEALDGMIAHENEAADDDHPDEELKLIIGEAKTREEAEKNAGDTFDRLDKNKDGNLSIDEILALVDKSDQTAEVKEEATSLVKAIDSNENGKVEKHEWSKAFGSIYELLNQKNTDKDADKSKADDKKDQVVSKSN